MIDLTKENCDAEVRQETSKPVVVDFWGPSAYPAWLLSRSTTRWSTSSATK